MAKQIKVPKTVVTNLESTLRKAKKDRWACNGDMWDLEKWIKLAKADKARQLTDAIQDADTDLRERLSSYVHDWAFRGDY